MSAPTVIVALLALVGASTALGFLWRRNQGRIRHTAKGTLVRATDVPGLTRLAQGVTLLQFSSEVCAPCRATSALLGDVAAERVDVTHVDLDVTDRPELATRFNVFSTPTTLIVDRRGVVRARIGGAPRRDVLQAELDRVLAA